MRQLAAHTHIRGERGWRWTSIIIPSPKFNNFRSYYHRQAGQSRAAADVICYWEFAITDFRIELQNRERVAPWVNRDQSYRWRSSATNLSWRYDLVSTWQHWRSTKVSIIWFVCHNVPRGNVAQNLPPSSTSGCQVAKQDSREVRCKQESASMSLLCQEGLRVPGSSDTAEINCALVL